MRNNIKRILWCWIVFVLIVSKSMGQINKLTPCVDLRTINRINQYNENLEKIFRENLKEDYMLRFVAKPSFNPEYAFQINKIEDANFEIAVLILHENLWNIQNNDSIQFSVISKRINCDFISSMDTLFRILTDSVSGVEAIGYGEDGVTYSFKYKSGDVVKCGEAWSPEDNSLLGDVVQICDNLILYAQGKNVDLDDLLDCIDLICRAYNVN